jgi:ketosteroid isomerase-like protein
MANAIETEITRLEDERCRAAMAGDAATLGRLMADDIVYTHSSARLDTKASFIESLTSGRLKYRRMHRRGLKVTEREGLAMLTGAIEIDVETGGQVRHLVLRYSNIWAKTATSWQQVLWQTTPIPPQEQ